MYVLSNWYIFQELVFVELRKIHQTSHNPKRETGITTFRHIRTRNYTHIKVGNTIRELPGTIRRLSTGSQDPLREFIRKLLKKGEIKETRQKNFEDNKSIS